MRKIRLFISHSWKHPSYESLVSLLQKRGYFEFIESSVPASNPLFGTDYEVWQGIENKIKWCQVVLLTADVHSSYSGSIKREIELAKKYNKPIIAVVPFGAERASALRFYATDISSWRADSIVAKIREHIR